MIKIGLIHLNKDHQETHSFLKHFASKFSDEFNEILIVDNYRNETPREFQEALSPINSKISFEYTDIKDIGLITKKAIVGAYENSVDLLVQFSETATNYLDLFSNHLKDQKEDISIFDKYYLGSGPLDSIILHSIENYKASGITSYKVKRVYEQSELFKLNDGAKYLGSLLLNKNLSFKSYSKEKKYLPINPIKNIITSLKFYLNYKNFISENKSYINPLRVNLFEDFAVEHKFTIPQGLSKEPYQYEIVDQDKVINQAEDHIRLDHEVKAYRDIFVVNWCLTSICNYKCSYCPDELHDGQIRGVDVEKIKEFFYAIKEKHPNKKLFFEFTGGEVTYYKKFTELAKFIKDNGADLGIISNGGRRLKFWEEHHQYLDHICYSYHSEQGDPDVFYETIKYMTDKTTLHVNIMMKPEKFDVCYQLAKRIAQTCEVSVAMQPLLEGMDGALFDYTPEQKKILDEQILDYSEDPEVKQSKDFDQKIYRASMLLSTKQKQTAIVNTPELVANEVNRWEGWDCYVGVENIVVDLNGAIMRGWCGVGGVIGNVNSDQIFLPEAPVLCNKSQCSCGLDIMTTKVKRC